MVIGTNDKKEIFFLNTLKYPPPHPLLFLKDTYSNLGAPIGAINNGLWVGVNHHLCANHFSLCVILYIVYLCNIYIYIYMTYVRHLGVIR